MIIGFDGSRAFAKGRTGTENYSYQVLKNLAKISAKGGLASGEDIENSYIVYVRPGFSTEDKWPKNFAFKVIKWPRLWTQIGLAKQTFKDKLDILFVPAHTSPLIHKKGLKTVVTVHDLGAEYLPKMHQVKQRLYLKWITNYQLKTATKLIAVSNATKEDLISKVGINPKKIEVVYEGFDDNLFKPVKTDIIVDRLKKFDLEPEEYFLFVGTIQPRKNLHNLISAYDSYFGPFKNAPKLILAGNKGWLSDEIYQFPRLLGIDDRVKFIGRVQDSDLPALYSGAIGLVYPSLFEGFGLPILEAFACECPVVASNVSSLPEVAGDAAIYCNPMKINDIARAMDKLLTRKKVNTKEYSESIEFAMNKEKRGEMVKKGKARLQKFSWEKCAKETLRVLESV